MPARGRRYHLSHMRLLALFLLTLPPIVHAEDARLDAIRVLLLPMRADGMQNLKTRGATPALTTVKHELRDWIESRLSVLQWNGVRWNPDPVMLQEQLNDELRRAELICEQWSKVPCPDQSELGFLGPVILEVKHEFLIVRTSVGIEVCGVDDSAYAYDLVDHQWRRFWQSEQNDYQEGKYFPQRLEEVQISPTDFRPNEDKKNHLILTLGTEPWCTSSWHDVYYRAWQTRGTRTKPVLLLSGKDWAYIGAPIHGTVTRTEVLTEYTVSGVGGEFPLEIRHYVLEKGRLERVDPVALSPRNFAAFWLAHPWPEISRWSAEGSRSKLKYWRQRHKGPFWEFEYPTLHCQQRPDLWQIATGVGEDRKHPAYFLIRWRPPYHFTMMSVSDRPSPDCKEEDREADEARSLFEALN